MVYRYTSFKARSVLRVLRLNKGFTQAHVGRMLNVTKGYISQIETGTCVAPRYRLLIKLLEVYGIKPKYFESLVKE